MLTLISEVVYHVLDKNDEAQAMTLDISKESWLVDFFHKPNVYGLFGRILNLIQSFLTNPLMKVVLNGHIYR